MRDSLALAIKRHLQSADMSAVQLERDAGLPNASIAKIIAGNRPRPERMARLLGAVTAPVAAEWLRCYLMDDVPETWRHRLQIIVDEMSASPRHSQGTSATTQWEQDLAIICDHGTHDALVAELIHDIAELLNRGAVRPAPPPANILPSTINYSEAASAPSAMVAEDPAPYGAEAAPRQTESSAQAAHVQLIKDIRTEE